MTTTIKIQSKKEIEEMIKQSNEKLSRQFYIELNKLRNQIINLDDLVKVMKRE